jgi:NADPH2:quinone reductase
MRAIVLEKAGDPDILAVTDLPIPEPAPGKVQIQVAYVAMNPLDVMVRAGRFRFHPALPFVLGYQYSGRITKVGEGVDAARVGQRVTVTSQWGGYADYATAPAEAAAPIPDAFDWKFGTVAMGPSLTAWHLVHTMARVTAGDVVVVHAAAGAVGLMLVQIAKTAGARVVGLVGSAAKKAWAEKFGADLLIDYTLDGEWPKKVKEFSSGRGANFIFDGNQGPGTPKNFQALAPLGQVIFIGAMAGPAPDVSIPSLIAGSQGIRGFVVHHGMALTKGAEFKEIVPMLASGKWQFPMTEPVPLESVADLHRAVEARTLLGRGIIGVGGEI